MQSLSTHQQSSFTTLIVDDSILFRKTLAYVLDDAFSSMRVIEAGTIADAKRLHRDSRADLVFVDIRLPDGNGLDLARSLRRRPGNPKICLMHAYDVPEYRLAALESGATHFLAKAKSTSEGIVAMVEAIMTRRAMMRVSEADADAREPPAEMLSVGSA